ncbi:MAG: glycoside hydrolase family 5 protein [Armatimonadetes bacterium]|nr:glycoside hydrolase family 5 protein [Armatimonadota bacterium]
MGEPIPAAAREEVPAVCHLRLLTLASPLLILAAACAAAAPFDRGAAEAAMESGFFKQLAEPLGRGINLGNMLEAPREGEWGVKLDERYFKIIADAGFTSVRMPVRWNSRADTQPPYTIDPAFFARVDRALKAAADAGLRVVLNIHHYEELMRDPPAHRDRFVALWEQISEHYRSAPPTVWFELLNEPNGKLDAATWNADLLLALKAVRRTNPERQVVVGPVMWNSVDALARLELPEDDRHLTVTFHYYNPFTFTHQGASWAGPQAEKWLGNKWLGTEKEQQAVIRQFDQALLWGVEHRRPIYLGEFGAYSRADMESRVRWTKFIAEQAMARKMGFAYWEFCSGFGAWDPEKGEWRAGLLGALMGR